MMIISRCSYDDPILKIKNNSQPVVALKVQCNHTFKLKMMTSKSQPAVLVLCLHATKGLIPMSLSSAELDQLDQTIEVASDSELELELRWHDQGGDSHTDFTRPPNRLVQQVMMHACIARGEAAINCAVTAAYLVVVRHRDGRLGNIPSATELHARFGLSLF